MFADKINKFFDDVKRKILQSKDDNVFLIPTVTLSEESLPNKG